MRRLGATTVFCLAMVATACGGSGTEEEPDRTPRGGTLRVVVPRDYTSISSSEPIPGFQPLDPTFEVRVAEILRCCLHRTLLGHPGKPTEDGGAQLLPDLASELPNVSADGLTWTFRIQRGIRYAPPLESLEVTAPDFVNAIRRLAKLSDPIVRVDYDVIQGFEDYSAGRSDSISGLETPDKYTLVVKLARAAGELGYLMTSPATGPIPSAPGSADQPFGVAEGHDTTGYGRFLVSTGPYMIEGSEKLDFSQPAASRSPVAGLDPGRSLHLVRNPSWKSSSDSLRPAYVDRIEVEVADDTPALQEMVTKGEADVVLDFRPPNKAVRELATKVRADPSLGTVHTGERDFVRLLSMNLATPPFDDLAVRRAVNFVIDKAAINKALGGPFQGRPAGHLAMDSLEQNILVAYDPYPSPDHSGDVERAKQEMKRSKYDGDRDGVCDAEVCRNIPGPTASGVPTFRIAAEQIARDLKQIGIDMRVEIMTPDKLFPRLFDPTTKTPLAPALGFGRGSLSANTWFTVFARSTLGSLNHSLLGATPDELRSWGYSVRTVPSVDDRIDNCRTLTGSAQIQCWASLDQYLMEEVVPWAPYAFESRVMVVSPRIVAFSYDQFCTAPALDRIAVRPGS